MTKTELCDKCHNTGLAAVDGNGYGWCFCPIGQEGWAAALTIALEEMTIKYGEDGP